MFKGKKGKALQEQIVKKSKEFAIGQLPEDTNGTPIGRIPASSLPTMEQIQAIKVGSKFIQNFLKRRCLQTLTTFQEAIGSAKSLAEVERLNQMLQAGQIPGRPGQKPGQNGVEMEEEETAPPITAMDTSWGKKKPISLWTEGNKGSVKTTHPLSITQLKLTHMREKLLQIDAVMETGQICYQLLMSP